MMNETKRIFDAADNHKIILRLFGGFAVRFHCPSATHRALVREYADIDFMGPRDQTRGIKKLFIELEYAPREIFNALQGDKRLIFNDLEHHRRIDIFLDVFEMCHKLDLKDRLRLDKFTIPLADLLVTKLQVVEITEREYKDIIALVHDHEVGDTDAPEIINGTYIASLCANDWGIYKTLTVNIANILSEVSRYELDPEAAKVVSIRLRDLQNMIETIPKTSRWKLRARIGERKRWYELPESDVEVVDWQFVSKDRSTVPAADDL